jgi:predicted PurR-regulated permease PerM
VDLRAVLIVASILGIFAIVLVGLGSALVPLLIAFGLAYLLFPLIKKIEAFGIKRHYTVASVFFAISILIFTLLLVFVPGMFSDAKGFIHELPENSGKFVEKIETLASEYGYRLDFSKEGMKAFILEHTSDISGDLLKGISSTIKGLFTNAFHWFLAILNLFLIPLFFFYVINDFEKLTSGLKSYVPPIVLPKITHYLKLGNQVLSGYIRGQLMVAAILSLFYGVGLSIVGLKFGFLIGFISGLISIIPYAGFTLGFLTSMMIGFANFNGFGTIVGILIVFSIVQALEGTVITPKLVGNKVGLSAFATMLALIVGGNLFGLVGMLIAIPLTAVLKTILIDLKREYHGLEMFKVD